MIIAILALAVVPMWLLSAYRLFRFFLDLIKNYPVSIKVVPVRTILYLIISFVMSLVFFTLAVLCLLVFISGFQSGL